VHQLENKVLDIVGAHCNHEVHWFTSWSGETVTDTHTHAVWWPDMSCSCIFAKKTELGFKDTTARSMDQGCGLILEYKISVTWMTIITEPLQSLFICCQVHLGDDNSSELRKLVMQHWLLDRPQLKCFSGNSVLCIDYTNVFLHIWQVGRGSNVV
jgi:hypothetical protein